MVPLSIDLLVKDDTTAALTRGEAWLTGLALPEAPVDMRVVCTCDEQVFRNPFVRFANWLLSLAGKHIDVWGTHALLLFIFADGRKVIAETRPRSVVFGEWNEAAKASAFRAYRDTRADERRVRDAWFYCKGREGVWYEFPLLVYTALRVFRGAWVKAKNLARGHGGVSEVCTTLVNGMAEAVFGQRYVDRPDPIPDEIAQEGQAMGWLIYDPNVE